MQHPKQGDVVAGKYQLVSRVSGGGMGSVWLGRHLRLDAPVAVKLMHPDLAQDADARARFEREAKAAAQIRSPHVVHVYDHGVDGEHPFLVMEFLVGCDLSERLRGGAVLPAHEIARICDEVCKGLARAHALGIVHRDLKPANVFLSAPDEDMVKLLDFGIAKETGARRVVDSDTTTGQFIGSPQYISPEQARGQPVDARSDLWSVGVMLYLAVTGARPFNADDVGDLIVRICTEGFTPATAIRPDLPPAIDAFFSRAMCRDRAGRFQSAGDLAAAFRAALGLAPSMTRPGHVLAAAPPSMPASHLLAMAASAPSAATAARDDTLAATAAVYKPRARTRNLLFASAAVAAAALGGTLAYAFIALRTESGRVSGPASPAATESSFAITSTALPSAEHFRPSDAAHPSGPSTATSALASTPVVSPAVGGTPAVSAPAVSAPVGSVQRPAQRSPSTATAPKTRPTASPVLGY
ncbi:MAG: protein kinase [Polyangiaceae bacterium]|nr:protein kinase [Polyangiaceae bacterium]